jgi:hypothetical protein
LARNPISKSNYREFFRILYPFIPIFKAATGRFHPKQKTRQWYYYQISSILLFKSSSESEELYLHLLEYYYHLKLLNTLPLNLPTLKLSTETTKQCFASQID